MALIAMAVWDTEENDRSWMTEQTLDSLSRTVDFNKHRLIISDNGSCPATHEVYLAYSHIISALIENGNNIGTAKAVNRAWEMRRPDEVAVKMDNDVVIHQAGWLDLMEEVFQRESTIGICGLKRKDLDECPWAESPWYQSTLSMLPHEKGQRWIIVEEVNHVIGTCQAYNPLLLDKIGFLYQMDGLYGFDDALASLRSNLAGFRNVFIPHIEIDHIDPGGTPYQRWKEQYGWNMMSKYDRIRREYLDGERPLYHRDEDNWRVD